VKLKREREKRCCAGRTPNAEALIPRFADAVGI
jgi:hypothetical protein